MTDLETMRQMLQRAKIEFTENLADEVLHQEPHGEGYRYTVKVPKRHLIKIEDGYPCFYTLMIFDLEGALVTVEAYE